MIPHIHIPALGPIKPFGLLVATGILVGSWFAQRRAIQAKVDVDEVRNAVAWAVIVGFVGAHLVALVYYKPERIAEEGFLSLLTIWNGISSFGGFVGALVGLFIFYGRGSRPLAIQVAFLAAPFLAGWLVAVNPMAGQIAFGGTIVGLLIYYWHPDKPWEGVAEIIVQALVVGWIFGRAGCTVAFDHPGRISDFPLAESYVGEIARHNLGLYEMLFTALVLTPVILVLHRRNPPVGLITGVVCVLYAPARFAMDYLRARDLTGSDVRVLGLTPAQFLCTALLLFGVWKLVQVRARLADPETTVARVMDMRPQAPETSPGGGTKSPSTGGRKRRARS